MMSRLGQEEVDDGVELQAVERLGGEVGVGGRHRRVEADRQEPLISPAWIASMISWAGIPLPGMSASSQPHTEAM